MRCLLVLLLIIKWVGSNAHGGFMGRGISYDDIYNTDDAAQDSDSFVPYMSRYKDEISYSLWPQNSTDGNYWLPYAIDDNYTDYETTEILEWAMQNIARGSNIRFRPKEDNDAKWLGITNYGGCAAGVGYDFVDEGALPVHLESPGCMVRNTAMHELMHTLGFAHEHQRGDAPNFIRIYFGSDPSLFGSLAPASSIATNSSYDIASVMHYYYYLRPLNETLYNNQQNRVPDLTTCDWYALNSWYPGVKQPPTCIPGDVPDVCEPDYDWCDDGEDVCEYNCRWFCVDTVVDSNNVTHFKCKLKGDGEFPVDVMTDLPEGQPWNPSYDTSDYGTPEVKPTRNPDSPKTAFTMASDVYSTEQQQQKRRRKLVPSQVPTTKVSAPPLDVKDLEEYFPFGIAMSP